MRDAIHEVAVEHAGLKGDLPPGDLGEALDSLQRLSLVVALEDRFRVRLDDVEEEIRSVDDLVRVLQEKTRA
ncbi:MAG: acyl carrier protein [Candidatus Xenobia bacterium]